MKEYQVLRQAFDNGHYMIVEGEVADFKTPSVLEKGGESFKIDDVLFCYATGFSCSYDRLRLFGGVVKGNGQNLRVYYIPYHNRNKIICIEEGVEP